MIFSFDHVKLIDNVHDIEASKDLRSAFQPIFHRVVRKNTPIKVSNSFFDVKDNFINKSLAINQRPEL